MILTMLQLKKLREKEGHCTQFDRMRFYVWWIHSIVEDKEAEDPLQVLSIDWLSRKMEIGNDRRRQFPRFQDVSLILQECDLGDLNYALNTPHVSPVPADKVMDRVRFVVRPHKLGVNPVPSIIGPKVGEDYPEHKVLEINWLTRTLKVLCKPRENTRTLSFDEVTILEEACELNALSEL